MEVACKDAFDQCVGRMVCQHQRDGRLVNDCIHRLRNDCFMGCDCHAILSLLNKLAVNAPLALSGKLHSSKEAIILHNPWQRVAFCQFGDLGTVHNVVEHLFSS